MKSNFHVISHLFFILQVLNIQGHVRTEEKDYQVQLHEDIHFGKLANGLNYYIKNVPGSKEKVDVRLYIRTGSLFEDPDQKEMAHFVEHMAFKPSTQFPNGVFNEREIWNQLNMSPFDLGGGAQLESTKFTFKAPPNNMEAISTAFSWFHHIADSLPFRAEEVNDERGALIQEFIFRSGITNLNHYRLKAELFPCFYDKSNVIEHLKTFDVKLLKQFYDQWYRPELMTIMVVGKIEDVQEIEELIKKQFSDLEARTNHPPEIPDCRTDYIKQQPEFTVVEADLNQLQETDLVETHLYFRKSNFTSKNSDLAPERLNIILNLMVQILNKRFLEARNINNEHFEAFISNVDYPPSILVSFKSRNNKERSNLKTTYQILNQIQKYGVIESEFQDAVDSQLDILNSISPDKNRFWIEGIEKSLKFGNVFMRKNLDDLNSWLVNFGLNDFQEFVTGKGFELPPDIGIIVPYSHDGMTTSEQKIRSEIESFSQEPISRYSLPIVPELLMPNSEINSLREKAVKDKGIDESGTREVILNNGVRILLKSFEPTGHKQDRIVLHGFSKFGALSFPKEDYYSALNAPEIIKNSGVGKLNKLELQRYLERTSIQFPLMKLYINNQESGIKVDSKLEDLESMLQLVYLYFTEPQINSTSFQDWKDQYRARFKNPLFDNKAIDFRGQIAKIIGSDSPSLYGSDRHDGLDKTDMNRGFEVYKELFGNGQDFTFLISGDFSMDTVISLVNKYLGNLPDLNKREFKNIQTHNRRLNGPVYIQFKTQDTINNPNYYYRPYYVVVSGRRPSLQKKIEAEALAKIVDLKLWELRFKKGYSLYTLNFGVEFNQELQQFEFIGVINCNAEEYQLIRQEFQNIITDIKSGSISQELLDQALKEFEQQYHPRGRMGSQKAIQNNLYEQVRFGTHWPVLEKISVYIKSLSKDKIVEAANYHFKNENLYEFVLSY